jgi:hypothetical protein
LTEKVGKIFPFYIYNTDRSKLLFILEKDADCKGILKVDAYTFRKAFANGGDRNYSSCMFLSFFLSTIPLELDIYPKMDRDKFLE